MDINSILNLYSQSEKVRELSKYIIAPKEAKKLAIKGLSGSFNSVLCAAIVRNVSEHQLLILQDRERAAYFCNDLEKLLGENLLEQAQKSVLFYPASYKRPYQVENVDNANILSRTEVLNRLKGDNKERLLVVTYPEALSEKVVSEKFIKSNAVDLHKGEKVSYDFLLDFFEEYDFDLVDFVAEPGQYALRGGIIDVFSFASDNPYRIEFDEDSVASLRSFDIGTQLSVNLYDKISILPNLQTLKSESKESKRVSFLTYFNPYTSVWAEDMKWAIDSLEHSFLKAKKASENLQTLILQHTPEELYITKDELLEDMQKRNIIEFGVQAFYKHHFSIEYSSSPQPIFRKNLDLLYSHILEETDKGYTHIILSENEKQIQRLERIFFELSQKQAQETKLPPVSAKFIALKLSLNEGFVDNDNKIAFFTDHQIFERYHRYSVQAKKHDKQALTLKELYDLKPGDYISHIDHGVGRFAGLEKVMANGREQEAICLVYKDNDMIRLSIHGLHKISKYSGKDGVAPTLHRLGGTAWSALKQKAKQKVKDIARELIKLYAERKSSKGFAFSSDNYLQIELESSFFYEDTPDQLKASKDVKNDMESREPMDRLVCGDVGFGKTEIAIRAAFKAVCDSKQVVVLVPTTILAYQHYKTFTERIGDLPCNIDYINRFRTTKDRKNILKRLSEGKLDILIGTHRVLSKDIVFKDLGLLIVDEEQKFGVAMKEKLKKLKVNVDTLTLTATPIPRTLQFSLMGARDLSIMQTPPNNRYPISTEITRFSEDVIRDAIIYELSRGGQVFFVHHRVENIMEMAGLIQRLIPDARIGVAHGRMDGEKLEEVLLGFMDGVYDILVATKIVENGLDIPNANTIIINEAQYYGLSELHQLRGRVGRSNRKAFCYLLAPEDHLLSAEAKRRLRAIEEFSDIGSGFQIAMRDLDIRGAGNILGGEQSGFISDIGFEMYQRILDEAISELRENEFDNLFSAEPSTDGEGDDGVTESNNMNGGTKRFKTQDFTARECVIEIDMEALIPDNYISNIQERLSLYKELDSLESDKDLESYRLRMQDRFGKLPQSTLALINTIALRREAKRLGWDKISLKNSKLTAYFAFNDSSEYYSSDIFTNILSFVQKYPTKSSFKETKDRLSVIFEGVSSIKQAIELCLVLHSTS